MVTTKKHFDLHSVKQDVEALFTDNNHWAYQYGSKATSCNKDTVFYKKQIQVIFEDRYPHDITGKAVNDLINQQFLKDEPREFGKEMHAIFVHRRKNMRYTRTLIKEKIKILEAFWDDDINDGAGIQAEDLFYHMFRANNFTVVSRSTNEYKGKKWLKSQKNLDFIIERDGVGYGVEIKNTFDYMKQYIFEEKLDICEHLGLLPLFPLRYASPQQLDMMKTTGGLALVYKTRIFPPGTQTLLTKVWNHFRLPVNVWHKITPPVESIFLKYHLSNLKCIGN